MSQHPNRDMTSVCVCLCVCVFVCVLREVEVGGPILLISHLRYYQTFHPDTAKRVFGKRLQLSAHQESVLASSFANNCYPNATTIKELAQQTMLDERRIRKWFARKRRYIRLRLSEGTLSSCEYIF